MEKRMILNEQAQEILRIAQEHGVEENRRWGISNKKIYKLIGWI